MFSDRDGIKFEITNKKNFFKSPNIWKLKNSLLNNPCVNKEIQWKLEN